MKKTTLSWKNFKAPQMVLPLVAAAALLLSGCQERESMQVHGVRNPVVETSPITGQLKPSELSTKAKIWFVKEAEGKLEYVSVERDVEGKEPLKEAVTALLAGPTQEESKSGIATEIPANTALIDVKGTTDEVDLDLSKGFSADGGSESIEARLEQLSRTAADAVHDKKVYLDVEGNRLSEAGGEGIEVRQPINM